VPDLSIEKCLQAVRLDVGKDGGVPLLHATSTAGAWAIVSSGRLIGREGEREVYVATGPEIAAVLAGDVLVPVRVAVDDLRFHRRWPIECDERLERYEFSIEGPEYQPLAVGYRAFDDAEWNAGPEGAASLDL
jgi:hypothetical protein